MTDLNLNGIVLSYANISLLVTIVFYPQWMKLWRLLCKKYFGYDPVYEEICKTCFMFLYIFVGALIWLVIHFLREIL